MILMMVWQRNKENTKNEYIGKGKTRQVVAT